jgi:UDP-2,3-diacylglucosamine pyrophosphatase LpxH
MRRQSVQHARSRGDDGIITGHTHFAEDSSIHGLRYLNTGCWTEPPCAYGILDSGSSKLYEVPD